jgi:hypothetical protein
MSAFASSPSTNPNPNNNDNDPQQLKDEAIALEGDQQYVEAHVKYEALLVVQQDTLGDDHHETLETMTSIMRVIDAQTNSAEAINALQQTAVDFRTAGRFERRWF